MPTLYENIKFGLPSEFARDVFLWAVDKFPNDHAAYKAEHFAREADHLSETVKTLLWKSQLSKINMGGRVMDEEQEASFFEFIMARHANYRTGGNRKINYCAQAAAE